MEGDDLSLVLDIVVAKCGDEIVEMQNSWQWYRPLTTESSQIRCNA